MAPLVRLAVNTSPSSGFLLPVLDAADVEGADLLFVDFGDGFRVPETTLAFEAGDFEAVTFDAVDFDFVAADFLLGFAEDLLRILR